MQKSIIELLNDNERLPKPKFCFYPEHDKCSNKIIKSHTIQNNKILSSIAKNGHVIALNSRDKLFFQSYKIDGKNVASTFQGFCGYHDATIFSPIENRDYDKGYEQTFLYTYRTFA